LRFTASASPRNTNVIELPSTIGKLRVARNASTASPVRGPAASPSIARTGWLGGLMATTRRAPCRRDRAAGRPPRARRDRRRPRSARRDRPRRTRGRVARGELADPRRVVEIEPEPRLGEHDEVAREAEAGVEHLGDRLAVRRIVVEQHDALGERHRAGRPRDDRARPGELGELEQAEAVEQDGDVAAGDHDRAGRLDRAAKLVEVARHDRTAARRELGSNAAWTARQRAR